MKKYNIYSSKDRRSDESLSPSERFQYKNNEFEFLTTTSTRLHLNEHFQYKSRWFVVFNIYFYLDEEPNSVIASIHALELSGK